MTRPIGSLLLTLVWLAIGFGDENSFAKFYPPSTVAYAELADPNGLIEMIMDHPLRRKIEALPPYQTALKTPQYQQFQLGLAFVETHFGMPWREALQTYATHGAGIGFDARSQGAAVILRGKDDQSMATFRDKLIELTRFGEPGTVRSAEYRKTEVHQVNQAWLAVHGDNLTLTNNPDLGKAILDRMIDRQGQSLRDNSRFQKAQSSVSKDQTMWAFVDAVSIRGSGVIDQLLTERIDNPVLEILAGGIQSTLQETPYVTAEAIGKTSGLSFRIKMPHQTDWIPEHREYFFGPDGGGRGPTVPNPKETLFTLSTYRDFSEMWLRAGDLFGEQTNDGFAQADANLTTLFAGRDFGEDILGSVHPEVGFVATRQNFDDVLPRPTIKLPAFAVMMELREPERMTRELRRIFQSLIGFLNVVGAMNGQNQLELEMEKIDGNIEVISSSFVPEEDERESTQAPIIYNFSPSVAFAGQRFVVSSTKSLARELITFQSTASSRVPDNTRAVLRASVLREVLDDNRGQLIAQNILSDGNSREEAEAITDLLLEVVGYFKDASLRLGTGEGELELEFRVRLNP